MADRQPGDPPKHLTLCLRLHRNRGREDATVLTTVNYDSRDCKVQVEGDLYPSELRLVHGIIEAVRKEVDHYPARKATQEVDNASGR